MEVSRGVESGTINKLLIIHNNPRQALFSSVIYKDCSIIYYCTKDCFFKSFFPLILMGGIL